MPAYILQKRENLLGNDRVLVTRFSDQQIGKKERGIDTATEALALQQAGNSMIAHKKGLLQETLSEVFAYAIELALLNWNSDIMFRITNNKGEKSFETFNPSKLNEIPLLIESDTDYIQEYKNKNKNAKKEDYSYMQLDNETRKVKYDLRVLVGAGLPNNRAYKYSIMIELANRKIISKKETRKFLVNNLGLSISEIPETIEEQQELGIFDNSTMEKATSQIQQSSEIDGLNQNNNVLLGQIKR